MDVDDFDLDGAAEMWGPDPRDSRKRAGKAAVWWTYGAMSVAALTLIAIVYALLSEFVF